MTQLTGLPASSSSPLSITLWRRIYERVGAYWKGLALAVLFMAGAAATQPTLAVAMKPLLDEGFSGAKPEYVWQVPLAIIALITLRGVCNFFSDYLLAWVANNVLLGVRADMFEKLLSMPDSEFKKGDTGRLLNRFTVDAGNVTSYATDVLTVVVRESLVVIAMIGVLLYMSWQLTLIILVTMPISVLISRGFIARMRRINRDTVNMNAELTRVVNEGIDGQRVVKLFDGYAFERKRFAYVSGRLRRFDMRAATSDAALTPITQVVTAIAVAAVISVALSQGNAGTLTVGSFAAFMAALAQIFDPVKRLTKVASRTQKMLVSAESVFILVDQPSELDQATGGFEGRVNGRVEFRAVSHRFAEAEVDTLAQISIVVEPGQTVALVGRSGSGKTTLVNMLPRFVAPGSGQVLIDNRDIESVSLRNLREQLSLVSQDVVLFDDTIAVNVGYGALHDASEAEIRAALQAANLLEFVDSLPLGIQTKVGENATRLSGGQRQRIGIARALYANPDILVFDEATSALDNLTERAIMAAIGALGHSKTIVVIAHRLSTVRHCDMVYLLEGGRVVAADHYDGLVEKNDHFRALHEATA